MDSIASCDVYCQGLPPSARRAIARVQFRKVRCIRVYRRPGFPYRVTLLWLNREGLYDQDTDLKLDEFVRLARHPRAWVWLTHDFSRVH